MTMGRGFLSSISFEMVKKEKLLKVEYLRKKIINRQNMITRTTYCCFKVKFFIVQESIRIKICRLA